MIGEIQRGLTSRIATADKEYVKTMRTTGIAARSAIMDSLTSKSVTALDIEPPPADACREDDCSRLNDVVPIEM
jgi:hypothetical protein